MKRRASSIALFVVGSVAWLGIVPVSLHATQILMPDFMSVPRYRDETITENKNDTFSPLQVALDITFYTANRSFSLPIFCAFLYMLVFLCCEVEKFKQELENGDYPLEDQARQKAKKVKNSIIFKHNSYKIMVKF